MLSHSRKITCHQCNTANFWKGSEEPRPADELYCQYCHGFIATHEDYLRGKVKREVSRIMLRYASPDSSSQLALLKKALSNQAQSGSCY